jgi:hypothetical protein
VVLDEDEKVLQTGQSFEAIVSDIVVQLEAISSAEARSELPPNFTINLHFLLANGLVVLSVLWVTVAPTSTAALAKVRVSKGDLGFLLSGTESISLVAVDGKSFSSPYLHELMSTQDSANLACN